MKHCHGGSKLYSDELTCSTLVSMNVVDMVLVILSVRAGTAIHVMILNRLL